MESLKEKLPVCHGDMCPTVDDDGFKKARAFDLIDLLSDIRSKIRLARIYCGDVHDKEKLTEFEEFFEAKIVKVFESIKTQ